MADLRCLDGSVLTIEPVPVCDRQGVPYEVTLRVLRQGQPFAEVGERCGFFLASLTQQLLTARDQGRDFPASLLEQGMRRWAAGGGLDADAAWEQAQRYLPRERELCALVARDPDDVTAAGELRIRVRAERTWLQPAPPAPGRWQQARSALVDVWGGRGTGLRAILDSAGLLHLLQTLLEDCAAVGVGYPMPLSPPPD